MTADKLLEGMALSPHVHIYDSASVGFETAPNAGKFNPQGRE